ncbi:hypothetical protein [Chitinophaga polysaccharea]|uniref:hypothetical protein n=1 Tax=Chitinophaga polysaccharea TaxID=1293035 RepID=UPI001158D45E|nr:hypothetical protein [Chitinophaga polysaccharea]
MKNGYKYFFYKMYRFAEKVPSPWWSEWKAAFYLSIIELMFLMSLEGYLLIMYRIDIFKIFFNIPLILVLLGLNYMLFLHNDKWKLYIKELDKQSRRQQLIGGLIVWSLVFLIFANLIFMFYLMSRIDWSLYR